MYNVIPYNVLYIYYIISRVLVTTYAHFRAGMIDEYHLRLLAIQQNADGLLAELVVCTQKKPASRKHTHKINDDGTVLGKSHIT